MTQQEALRCWKQSSQEDTSTARILFENKRYAHCLFFCHLALEKLLKARIIQATDDAPPVMHDLVKLVKVAQLSPTNKQLEQLREITTFNIEARYDIHKKRLYKKATASFTKDYLTVAEELLSWIQKSSK